MTHLTHPHRSTILTPIIATLLVAASVGLADHRLPGDTRAAMIERYGMIRPRPVETDRRRALGYPDPRPGDVILRDIDELAARMQPILERDDVWDTRVGEYRHMQRERIALVSELEESGYDGARLLPLLETKVQDVRGVWDRARRPVAAYSKILDDIAERYADHDVGRVAAWYRMVELVQIIRHAGLHIAEPDLERLAAIDAAMPDRSVAGILLLEALHGEKDATRVTRWHEWILENLDPSTRGYRIVMRRRIFGAPIRLQGEGLDGAPIDTAAWKGDVILVDFWGTWCQPCIAAMPHLKELYDRYADRGLRIVGVLSDHEVEKAARFTKERGYSWPQLTDRTLDHETWEHPIARRHAIGAYPTLWIIDRHGVLREEADRDRLEEQLVGYLDETE
ncbi:MAG: redoxin domain-containing protein [Phycisphaerales bacterium]|nr:redoxin domain-containing protein [Phycisphaerales bacterium]